VNIQQPSETATIRLNTPFGDFEAGGDSIVTFPDGLPGFEQCRRFVVLRQAGTTPLVCLHAVDGPAAAFLAIDPRSITSGYRCVLSDSDRLRLGAGPGTTLLWLSIVTIVQDDELYVNLRAPVVINPERLVGIQTVPQRTAYPLRQRIDLPELARTGTDGPSCSS
jgi:flagellar assembly factor FliW